MAWIYLVIAGALEIGFTTSLKLSNNFTNWKWAISFFVCAILSFLFLNKAIQTIPLGTAYAVWTGIGAVGTALMGIWLYKEPGDFWRILFLFTLIASIVGLKVVSK